MTETDEQTAFLAKLRVFEGVEVGVEVGADPVNQPMIRHWVEAIGDDNPVYVDPDAAAPARCTARSSRRRSCSKPGSCAASGPGPPAAGHRATS